MDLLTTAKKAALEAGDLLKQGFGTSFQIESKEGKQNLVTEYDLSSQKLIVEILKGAFPTHHFLAEEGDLKQMPSDEILWIIDPLDGTVNFAHNIPLFAVSIAAARGNEILAGVIYQPLLDELFASEKGSGAYLGKNRLQVTDQKNLEEAFTATGFPYDAYKNPMHCIERFGKMVAKGIPIRRLGVASIDLAYVAMGRFDLFWEVGLHPWDMAAGKLLIEEAGGKVTHYDGSPHQIYSYLPILASNGHLHEIMVDYLKEDLA
ncbi:MAG: Inositol-1-monophosphatase [Chlamydiae bacterium]|nr:Inositol-1-monophosphatase [Chlamydiota bacterium]